MRSRISQKVSRAQVTVEEIENLQEKVKHLEKELRTDDLTGLQNARSLRENLPQVLTRRLENGERPGLLFLDIDFFKKINEEHGHRVGSELLRQVGDLIKRNIRKQDLAFRYGGDEFVIVVSGGIPGLKRMGERLRAQIEKNLFEVEGLQGFSQIRLSISVGAKIFSGGEDPWKILEEADRALFEAKRRSRNTVQLAA